MRVLMVIYLAFGILFAAVVLPRTAFAQGGQAAQPAADTPDEAKRKGDEAMVALRFQEALAHYQRAYEATKSPALLYNMGRAYEGLAEFPKALDALEEFNDKAPAELKARIPKGVLEDMLRDIRNRVATLVVSCSVENADLRLGDKIIGRTRVGQTVIRVNAGKQKLVVSREGYFSFDKELTLVGGKVETVDAVLASRSEAAVLRVTSPVEGASVALDGKPMGVVPVESPVLPGTHKVGVTREGYEDADTSVVVAAGERKDLAVPLAKKASIFSRWWFWTAVGVVAIGVTTTIVVLNTEKDADTGTIAPGQVRADLSIGAIRF
jgi:hypothetical protein